MYPAAFSYVRATSVADAVRLLTEHGDDAKLLAGGHSILPAMYLRLAKPATLIYIGSVPELNSIALDGDTLVIGAATPHRAIERSVLIAEHCPLLASVVPHIGDVQVRARGTIGGSLAHADPAGDWPAAILALGADLTVVGPTGQRTIPAGAFFRDILTTALASNEVLTSIRITDPGRAGAYEKMHNPASGYAIVGVAVAARVAQGVVQQIGIGITGAAAVPSRAAAAEQVLIGTAPTAASIAAAGARAAEGLTCLGDIHATPTYRQHMVSVLTQRALTQVLAS